jgi:predicted O-linked N-acetylglucosamine transferase (SPINDLY family)
MATLSEALHVATAQLQANRPDLADEIARRILAVEPDHAPAWHLRGSIAYALRQLPAAAEWLHRAATLAPTNAGYYNDLGLVLLDLGHPEQAAACFQRTLALNPDLHQVYNNLANALMGLGRAEEAAACYRRAIQGDPNLVVAYNNLGNVLLRQGKFAEAVENYQQAIARKPDYVEPHSNIAPALQALGRIDEAIAYCRRALEMRPDFNHAYTNMGLALQDRGEIREAIAAYQQTLRLKPDEHYTHSNVIFAMHFCPDLDPAALRAELRRWNERFAEPLVPSRQPHPNDRHPDRRLRVGYVSADFNGHPVGQFMMPLLEAHDRVAVEVVCYSSVSAIDRITELCRQRADIWRDVRGLNDAQLADAVRADQVDVLVDLSMHAFGSRLLTFARKPAPVQVTYLAYCSTTGITGMDYRLTDRYLDPPGEPRDYSEQSVYLPDTYWCYQPFRVPESLQPASAGGGQTLTFGCLSNSAKLSEPALAAWAALLHAVPGAKLLLHARQGGQRDRVQQLLAAKGIGPERLEFVDRVSAPEYYRTYQRIDVVLDPFPYGGGTTTCDALWMGVPVVTLAGRIAVGRGGVSILSNVGLPELIAQDVGQYVTIAAELGRDTARRAALREGLRARMQQSPLMDIARFARNIEAAYRGMWQRWCAS